MNVLIVDDEQLAHEVLLHLCRAHDDLNVVGQCLSAAEALTALETSAVDLMFVDIRMPHFGGLDLLRGLEKPPMAVIVSAHKEHALDGYELDVIDYLLKPVGAARFASAMEKVRRRVAESQPQSSVPDHLSLKVDRAHQRFYLREITCFEGQGNFVKVHTDNGAYLATITLRKLLELLPNTTFIQSHKSYIVNQARIAKIATGIVELDDRSKIPVGKSFRNTLALLR